MKDFGPSAQSQQSSSPANVKIKNSASKEIRCIKFSPSVKPSKHEPNMEKFECESRLWREAFDSMGKLNALGLDDVKTFTKLSEQPYQHCAPNGRTFVAAYGPLARIENKKPKEKARGHKYYAGKKDSTPPCIAMTQLPTIKPPDDPFFWPNHLLTGRHSPEQHYIPKSAIRLYWGGFVTDNTDLICDWLTTKFGPILFTIREGRRCLIVVYKDIKASHNTVNAGIPPKIMKVTWCDPRFYNYGHYSMYKNYTLSEDPIWQRGLLESADG